MRIKIYVEKAGLIYYTNLFRNLKEIFNIHHNLSMEPGLTHQGFP